MCVASPSLSPSGFCGPEEPSSVSLPLTVEAAARERESSKKSLSAATLSLSLHAPPVLYPLSWNMERGREAKRKETLGFSSLRHIQAGIEEEEEEEERQVPQKQRRRRLRCWRRRQSLLLLLYVPFSLGGGGGGGSAEGKAAQ